MSKISGFRFSSNLTGLGNLSLSVAHNTVADNSHTVKLIPLGTPVIAISTVAGSGTYVIYGMAMGGVTTDNPYEDDYKMIHTVKWMGGPVFVPESVVPVCSTNVPSLDLCNDLLDYVIKS